MPQWSLGDIRGNLKLELATTLRLSVGMFSDDEKRDVSSEKRLKVNVHSFGSDFELLDEINE